jgi:hypothetical protein
MKIRIWMRENRYIVLDGDSWASGDETLQRNSFEEVLRKSLQDDNQWFSVIDEDAKTLLIFPRHMTHIEYITEPKSNEKRKPRSWHAGQTIPEDVTKVIDRDGDRWEYIYVYDRWLFRGQVNGSFYKMKQFLENWGPVTEIVE